MIVQIRSLAKQHAVSTAAWEETVAWLQSFRTSVPEVKLALGHASRPFGEQVGQAPGEHSNPLSQRSCTSRFDSAEAAWARAMIEVEMKFAMMKKDIDSIRQVVLGGHVDQRRYADVARSYSVVLRRLLELHGAVVLPRSNSKLLSFVHMLLRLKEYAGLQRALTAGMLGFRLATIPHSETVRYDSDRPTCSIGEGCPQSSSLELLPGRDELRAPIAIFSELKDNCSFSKFSPAEAIARTIAGGRPSLDLLRQKDLPLAQLIQRCWSVAPLERCTFGLIVATLEAISAPRSVCSECSPQV